MKTVKIKSNISGTKSYDIYPPNMPNDGPKSVRLEITPGDNEIREDYYELLVLDPGFRAQVERNRYEELSAKEIVADKTVKDAKADHVEEIKKLKSEHAEALKKVKEESDQALKDAEKKYEENLTNLRGDKKTLEDKVKSLEDQVKTMDKEKKDLSVQANDLRDQLKKLETALKKAKNNAE